MYDLSAFSMIRTLGFGEFGKVCLLKYHGPYFPDGEEFMACKLIEKQPVSQANTRIFFESEVAIMRELQNFAFFPKLYMISEISKKTYVFMEFCEGGEIFTRIRSKNFSYEDIRFYAAEILMAIKHMHEKGIVYRDLKPENIMLTREGHIKIVDFGLSSFISELKHEHLGTPEFMSPEIAQALEYSFEADFWSFGVLLYEMQYARTPFKTSNPKNTVQVLHNVLNKDPVFDQNIDKRLKDLIIKLLIREKDCRIISIEDIVNHQFFQGINWDDVINLKLKPPIIPIVDQKGDCQNFEVFGGKVTNFGHFFDENGNNMIALE